MPDSGPWQAHPGGCACPGCGARRARRRELAAQQNHPIYAARGNEQPLLEDHVAANPPVGGMAAYIADLDRSS